MNQTIKERKKRAIQARYLEVPPFPTEVLIDVTSQCNHACVFCANQKLPDRTRMSPDLIRRVLQEAFDNGVTECGLYATGEPFLIKDLDEHIGLAKKIGYRYVYITTNGAAATPERAKAAVDAGLDSIKFSIHAGTAETYHKIHGKNDFARVMANLEWVARYRKTSGKQFRIYVTMVISDLNRHEVDLLRQLTTPHIDEWDPHLLTNSCGTMPENNDIGYIEPENIRGRNKSGTCFQPFKSFTVTPEGLVSACVLDYQNALIVGDLRKNTLAEIWDGPVYREFRRRHLEGRTKGSICHNCIYNANEPVTPLMAEYSTAPAFRIGE